MDPKNYWPSAGQQAEGVSSGRNGRLRLTVSALAGGIFLVVMIGLLFATTIMASPAVQLSISPATQTISAGGTADFTVAITNSGTVTLTQIVFKDNFSSFCDHQSANPIPDLGPSQSSSYSCSTTTHYENFSGTGIVTAIPEGGGTQVSATDTVEIITQQLRLLVSPELQTIGSGQPATLTIVVSNTEPAIVTQIVVTSTAAPDCSRPVGTLADLNPGGIHTYTCQTPSFELDSEGSVEIGALLSGTIPLDDRGEYRVEVLTPLEITLSPERQIVMPGSLGSFSVVVRNNGAATLTNVAVEALTAPNCERSAATLADLAPGGSHTYSCVSPPLHADTTTQLTASAQEGAVTVKATASAFVDANPPIDIEVSPEIQFVEPGMTATFMVTLSNTLNNISLIDIMVDAPETPGCVKSVGQVPDLVPGASHSYTCEALIVDKRFVHTLTAFGSPYDGDPVTDQAVVFAGRRQLYFPLSFRSVATDEAAITPP